MLKYRRYELIQWGHFKLCVKCYNHELMVQMLVCHYTIVGFSSNSFACKATCVSKAFLEQFITQYQLGKEKLMTKTSTW